MGENMPLISFRRSSLIMSAVVGLIAAGCGGGNSAKSTDTAAPGNSTAATSSAADPKVVAELPPDVKSKGTLTVATDTAFPPMEYVDKDGKTLLGIDPDLAKALAAVMGLKPVLMGTQFDSILPGLQAGKYDLAMSSFAVTQTREQVVDMISYFNAGNSFYVSSKANFTLNKSSDLCGHRIAVLKGSNLATDAIALAKKCSAKTPVLQFPSQSDATLAITAGRADVSSTSAISAEYIAKQSDGEVKVGLRNYAGTIPFGVAVKKDSALAKPIRDAIAALIANGTYKKILDKWDAGFAALKSQPEINPHTDLT
jgi:polar amino acid transport system substrate-binding protein